ncbi:MAG: SPOR domain-containing protein, partial [Acidobacteriota bacterium]
MSRILRCNSVGRHDGRRLRFLFSTLVAVLLLPAWSVLAGQAQPTKPPAETSAAPDPEAEQRAAPVLLSGEPIIWITAGAGPYTQQYRAERIAGRLEEAVHDRSIKDPTITITDKAGDFTELRVGPRLLMVVTEKDAASLGVSRAVVAQQFARELEAAIRAERWRYAPERLLRSGLYGLLATLAFIGVVWGIQRISRLVRRALERRLAAHPEAVRVLQAELVSTERLGLAVTRILRWADILLVLVAFDLYLTYVLGLFPWTRAVSRKLLEYVMTPIRAVGESVIGYLPKLLFLVVIVAIFYTAIKLVAVFFRRIRDGR